MALTITNISSCTGGEHLTVTVDREGATHVWKTSRAEIDSLLGGMEPVEQYKLLVLLWAKYRRLQGRAIQNVSIA